MARIISSNGSANPGRPGFRRFAVNNFTGILPVNRLFKRDPAGKTANWGKGRLDPIATAPNNLEDLTGASSPTKVRAPHDQHEREKVGTKVIDRSANRSRRITKN